MKGSSQLPVYFGGNAEYSPHVYSQGQSCGPEEATMVGPLRALVEFRFIVVSGALRTRQTKFFVFFY